MGELDHKLDDYQRFLQARNVEVPCRQCSGLGVRSYGSTATWRGGIGGQTITSGVCDQCWGSGDADRPWADLQQLEWQLKTVSHERDQLLDLLRRCMYAESHRDPISSEGDHVDYYMISPQLMSEIRRVLECESREIVPWRERDEARSLAEILYEIAVPGTPIEKLPWLESEGEDG